MRAFLALYIAAGIVVSSVAMEWNRHRCFDVNPIWYVGTSVLWPGLGAVVIGHQLFGSPSPSRCGGRQ